MTSGLRKFALTAHITFSVGWIGAIIAYLMLDVTVATSQDAQVLRASYLAMALITRYAIVPLALASLLTGIIISLGTKWGLFQHYWVLISLVLTIIAIIVLLFETQQIIRMADIVANPTMSGDARRALPNTLVHSIGGMVILLIITVLNVYKPRGLTPYGWRKQHEQRTMQQSVDVEA
jgi:uncharacterized membrane protein YeiB